MVCIVFTGASAGGIQQSPKAPNIKESDMKNALIAIALTASLILAGCSGKKAQVPEPEKPQLVLPIVGNATGKVQIQTVSGSTAYPFNSYIITSAEGESVIVDPTEMPPKSLIDLKPAAIVSTHGHMDHTDPKFTESYDCQKISYTKADIKTRDFHIYTILSCHQGNTLGTSNVIIVFEVDGLRIAHMGDIGQDALTKGQLKELGKIDIAFMQFENNWSSMRLASEKGFKLIEQLNPMVVVPTHYTDAALPVLEKKYGKITDYVNVVAVSKADIPTKPLTVWRILNTHKYQ